MKTKLIIFLLLASLIFNIMLISVGDCKKHSDTIAGMLDRSGGGGSHIPFCQLDINFSVSKINANRSEPILLTAYYYINKSYNKNYKKNITEFSYIDYLNKTFKIVEVDGSANKGPIFGKIEINGTLNISDSKKTKNWTLMTDIDTAREPVWLFDTIRRVSKTGNIDGKSKKEKITIKPNILYFDSDRSTNIKIHIKNNLPIIDKNKTKVIVSSPQIGDDQTLIYWDSNNPLEVNHIVSATDKENNNKLQYIWIIENENKSCEEFTTNLSNSINHWKLKSGENYTFHVRAKDSEGDYSESIAAKIVGKDNNTTYMKISVPSWEYFSTNLVLILIIAVLISIISFTIKFKSDLCIRKRDIPKIFMFKFKKYLRNFTINPLANALISTPLVTIIFVSLFTLNVKFWHIYSISLAFYELYPFVVIYILFGYLAEERFFKTDKNSSKYNIILINDILMIFILISFYGISSGITHDIYAHLSNYYSTITQVSGTLLGFILGFYIAKFDNTKKERSKVYLNTLEYLVLLYGTIIILSLWGLSMSETIYFTPLIEFKQENLSNIVSIWVFESTLLLSPLAITSLYRLIKAAN